MKRYFKKGITVVMTLALMMSCVACGKKNDTKNTATNDKKDNEPATNTADPTQAADPTEAAPTEEESAYTVLKDANGNVYDLGGMEIIVADWWSPEVPAEPTNAQQEAQREYQDWLETTYNFKIQLKGISSWGDHPETFINFATTGGDENYVFCLRDGSFAAPMNSGLMYDLSTLDCLDFTKDKWNSTTFDLMTVDGKIYGMRPMLSEVRGGMFFNKRLLQEANIDPESIYDMQADGTWTWDAFDQMCAKITRDTDSDGVIDVYGMVNFAPNLVDEAIASNGATYIDKDENGKYVNATNRPEFLAAVNWVQEMVRKYEMPQPEGNEDWAWSYPAFDNAQAAFMSEQAYRGENLKGNADDYGFVFFPKGPNAETYKTVYSDNIYCIPACYDADRAWKIAFAYNLFTDPTPGFDDPDAWLNDYYPKYRDSRAVDETIKQMAQEEHGLVWFHRMIDGLDTGNICNPVYQLTSTGAEASEACWSAWQALIDEANGIKAE